MSNKASVTTLKKLIRETRMEEAYRKKFVESFSDVRKPNLTEEQLDSLAEILYDELLKK